MNSEKINEKHIQRKKWSYIPYEKKDLPAIGLFFKKNYSGAGSYGSMSLFQWKIVDNYLNPGFINLIKDKDKIVSITSVVPKSLIYKSVEVAAGEIGDTYTDPQYHRQGMFTIVGNKTRENATNSGINFVYGLPNEQALPGWEKKANFKVIQNLHVRSLTFPVDIRPRVQKRSHWIFGSIIGSIFSMLLFLYYKIKNIFFFLDKSIVIEEKNRVPQDWKIFWNHAMQGYDFIINRNIEATTWRYIDNPNKYKLITLRKNEVLIGYLVCRNIHDEDVKRIIIADYLTLRGEENALFIGINFIINRAFKIGANQVDLWCVENSLYFKVFLKKGFFSRGNVPVICYQNEFAEQVENCTSWHFTISDSDNI